MDEKVLFKSYLTLFTEADFPLILSYSIDEPDSFSDDPLPLPLSHLFVAEEDPNADPEEDYNEYVPVVKFRINKNYLACVVWKATLGSYEFLLIIYDNDGGIQETDSIAGTYYATDPITYKVAEFSSPTRAAIVEGNIKSKAEEAEIPFSQKFILNISDIGEINYAIVGNI